MNEFPQFQDAIIIHRKDFDRQAFGHGESFDMQRFQEFLAEYFAHVMVDQFGHALWMTMESGADNVAIVLTAIPNYEGDNHASD